MQVAAAAEAAASRIGGVTRRLRLFRRVDEIAPAPDGSPPRATLAACAARALRARGVATLEPLEAVCARICSPTSRVPAAIDSAADADYRMADTDGSPPEGEVGGAARLFRQARRLLDEEGVTRPCMNVI